MATENKFFIWDTINYEQARGKRESKFFLRQLLFSTTLLPFGMEVILRRHLRTLLYLNHISRENIYALSI